MSTKEACANTVHIVVVSPAVCNREFSGTSPTEKGSMQRDAESGRAELDIDGPGLFVSRPDGYLGFDEEAHLRDYLEAVGARGE
jgi:hypothetical protein